MRIKYAIINFANEFIKYEAVQTFRFGRDFGTTIAGI